MSPRRCSSTTRAIRTIAATALLLPGTSAAQITTQSRDSAGIRVVENRIRGEPPAAFVLSSNPVVEFGGQASDSLAELVNVSDALRLPDGRFVVALSVRTVAMRMFDANGKYLSTIARSGEGPGELPGWPSRIHLRGRDTIAAIIPVRGVTLFDSRGGWIRKEPIPQSATLSWLRSGLLLSTPSPTESLLRYTRRTAAGGPADSGFVVARAPRGALISIAIPATADARAITAFVVPPFGRRTSSAELDDDGFIVGDGASFEIRIHDAGGALRGIIRRDADLTVRPADIEEFRTTVASQVVGSRRGPIDQWLSTIEIPKTKPAFVSLTVDGAGRIWAEIAASGYGQPLRYSVFERGGRLLGNLTLPQGFTPYDIGADYILGGFTDADGFRRLQVYTLAPPRS